MRKLPVLTGLIFILAGTSTAQAGLVRQFHWSASASEIAKTASVNLKHTRYVCKNGTGKEKRSHCRATRWLVHVRADYSTPVLAIPHYSAWNCIHQYEGAWNDAGDPYWGGLQMDKDFMRTYAPRSLLAKGWANSWTPIEQMWVAERAYRSGRGFWPWPNTARYCRLL